jgi:hypothetical protein
LVDKMTEKIDPEKFLRTIYLGDRACKKVIVDGWNSRISIEVDVVSRSRNPSGAWDFNSDEDVPDGMLVFSGAESFDMEPGGVIPNDLINDIQVSPISNGRAREGLYEFHVSIGSVRPDGANTEVLLRIVARGVHLEDPARPGVVISD